MKLATTLKLECASCPWIEVAWCSPTGKSFTIQALIKRHESTNKHWKQIEPQYSLSSEATRAITTVVNRVKLKCPGTAGYMVSYLFKPGAKWAEVYRKK